MVTAQAKQQVKKGWFPIIAPKLFNEGWVGEVFIADPAATIGRIVTVSMTVLTNDPQRQHVLLSFRITGQGKQGLTTELVSYHFSPNATKRFVRRSRSKMDDSFTANTADGKKIRIKPMIVTRSKAQGGVRAAMVKATREFFILHLSKMKLEQFWSELVNHNIQKGLGDQLRKLYPLSACEVRWAFIAGEGVPNPEALKAIEAKQVSVEEPAPAAEAVQ
jgi:ribosomal protein S3AE